jgi:YD repeat-containing protein
VTAATKASLSSLVGAVRRIRHDRRVAALPNSAGTLTNAWNADGTLASVKDWNSKTTTFSYNKGSGRLGDIRNAMDRSR